MKIIADAGSTKIDWAVIDSDIQYYHSQGWNPTQDQSDLLIENKDLLNALANCVQLNYYSTGAGAPLGINRALSQLRNYIPNSEINIWGDMLGAARALFNDTQGIAVIIGTGSNVSFYDGNSLSSATPSLGYLLSDEGSGFAIGRDIVKDYFYDRMPSETHQAFEKEYALDRSSFLNSTYSTPRPNATIAKFAKFLKTQDNDWKRNLISSNFTKLATEKILRHKNFLSVPVGFVGTIALAYEELLREVCYSYGIQNIRIIARPLDALIKYHAH